MKFVKKSDEITWDILEFVLLVNWHIANPTDLCFCIKIHDVSCTYSNTFEFSSLISSFTCFLYCFDFQVYQNLLSMSQYIKEPKLKILLMVGGDDTRKQWWVHTYLLPFTVSYIHPLFHLFLHPFHNASPIHPLFLPLTDSTFIYLNAICCFTVKS